MEAALAVTAWLALRLAALLAGQVVWARLVGGLWAAVAGGLAVVLAGAWTIGAAPTGVVTMERFVRGAAVEAVAGGALGLVVALPGHALVGAARVSGRTLVGGRSRALEALVIAVVAAVSVGLGAHRPLLAGLWAVLGAWPAGEVPLVHFPGAPRVAGWAAELLGLALALATPVLLVQAVGDVGLRLCGRSEEDGALGLRPWLVALAAALALGASIESYPEAWARSLASGWSEAARR